MTRDKYKHPPRRVWITWDDAYPWEFERPDATEYMLVIKTGGFTCACCGRNTELRVNGKFCNECAGYRSAFTSDSARRAAEEIQAWANEQVSHVVTGNVVEVDDIAAIISKHFGINDVENVSKPTPDLQE